MSDDQGAITALLQRFTDQRLPRALEIKARVDAGERLQDSEIEFLETVFKEATQASAMASRHPEFDELRAKVMSLYHEITTRALENEQAGE